MKHLKRFNEMVENDDTKAKLESLFPQVEDLEPIGKGMYGQAYIGTIGTDMVVAKLTKSLPEYWLSQMAMVSNPPHVVKFLDVKPYDESKYEYGILHEWVSRDALPTEETWNLANKVINGLTSKEKAYSKLTTNEEKYEFDLAMTFIKDVEGFFGFDIDTLHQNIGYDSNNKLVLFDLDGNVTKPKYKAFMGKHQK
jgi:hypothetical protein